MAILFTNNASSNLAASLTAGASSLTITTGDGALFPSPTGGDYFLATISEGSTVEIVKVTARSSDTFTITRAQESTSAAAFSTTATVELRLTAGILTGLIQGGASTLLPYAVGDLVYASSTSALSKLAIGAAAGILQVNSGATAPAWFAKGTAWQALMMNSGATAFAWTAGVPRITNYQDTTPTNDTTITGWRAECGQVSIAGNTGVATVTKTVTFQTAFATARIVLIGGGTVGGERVLWRGDSLGASSFVATATTVDASNFNDTTSGTAYWLAIGDD